MNAKQKVNQYVSFCLLLCLGGLIAFGLLSILNSILGAIILHFLLKPIVSFLESKLRFNRSIAISSSLLLTFALVLLPLLVISFSLADKAATYLQHPEVILEQITLLETVIYKKTKIDILSDANIEVLKTSITKYVTDFLGQTINMLATIGIMYFILYFMLLKSESIEENIKKLLPYSEKESLKLKKELNDHVFSNVIISPLLALLQGVCACILFWLTNLQEPLFWGVICGIFSLIPFVGSAIVWIPAGLYLITQNNTTEGVSVLIFGALIISNIDNVFRFVLQKRFADIHPVVTVLGVIIGIYWFGFTGIIFGPLLISFFLILLKNYRKDHVLSKS
jgi:predicted PurR-regulated permease PerM